jgi:ribonuclease HI
VLVCEFKMVPSRHQVPFSQYQNSWLLHGEGKANTIACMADSDVPTAFESIALYADGSFSQEVAVGAWAFKAPELNLEGAGSGDGKTVTQFEFLGVLEGLEAVAAADQSGLPIHVFSDCNSTVADINFLRKGEPFKKPERYADRADLVPRLQAVLAVRQVHVTRYTGGSLHHQDCHRKAHRLLRERVDHDPKTLHRLALKRQRSRLSQLIGERQSSLNRLAKLDEEVSILQLQVAALELSSRMTDGDRCAPASSQSAPGIEASIVDLSLPSADSASGDAPVDGACSNAGGHVGSELGDAANA